MNFKKWVKSIQTAGYNGARTVYRSRAGRHFYGTENVVWAGFGPIGNTEKKS